MGPHRVDSSDGLSEKGAPLASSTRNATPNLVIESDKEHFVPKVAFRLEVPDGKATILPFWPATIPARHEVQDAYPADQVQREASKQSQENRLNMTTIEAASPVSGPKSDGLPSEAGFSVQGSWRRELSIMMKLALPCILANASTQIMVITSQIFVGSLGVEEFAAAALANTWFNLLWAFITGAATAMDTLASQAYGGKDYRSLLVWTYSGCIIMSLYCIPIFVALYMAEHVTAVLFHQGYGEVAALAKQFCIALIPGMWPMVSSLMLMKFLQTQNCMAMPAYIVLFSCVANIGLNFAMVDSYGFVGAAWATTLCRVLQLILMLAACIYQQHAAIKRASLKWVDWFSVSRASLRAACNPRILWEFGKLSLAGGAMNAFEGGACEVTTAFAGALGTVETAAHSAVLSICITCFNSLPFAVSIAGSIRVANLLGAGKEKQARLSSWIGMILGVSFQSVAGIAFVASQGQVVKMFTRDDEVLEAVQGIVYLAMAFLFSDGVFGVAQGVLRGMGKQGACVLYNVIGFWGFGVLLGYLLTFQARLGLTGLWAGLFSGDAVAALLSVIALARCDWRHEAVKAYTAIQEAAMEHVGDNDARQQLVADVNEGFVAGVVDLSAFDVEVKFFVVPPEDVPQDEDDQDNETADPAYMRPNSRIGSMAAPATMSASRGASVTAAILAQARISIVLSRTQSQHRSSNPSFRSSMIEASQMSRYNGGQGIVHAGGDRTSLGSVNENDSYELKDIHHAHFQDRDSRQSRNTNEHGGWRDVAYAGSLAATLSRGGSMTSAAHHRQYRRSGIGGGLTSTLTSFINTANADFSRYSNHQRPSNYTITNDPTTNRTGYLGQNDRPSRTSWGGDRNSIGQLLSGVFLFGHRVVGGSITAPNTNPQRHSNHSITSAGRAAAALSRGGSISASVPRSGVGMASRQSSTTQDKSHHGSQRGASPPHPAIPMFRGMQGRAGLTRIASQANGEREAEEEEEQERNAVTLNSSKKIQIPSPKQLQEVPKPHPTTSALRDSMEAGIVLKLNAKRRQRMVSLRSGIMRKGMEDAAAAAVSAVGPVRRLGGSDRMTRAPSTAYRHNSRERNSRGTAAIPSRDQSSEGAAEAMNMPELPMPPTSATQQATTLAISAGQNSTQVANNIQHVSSGGGLEPHFAAYGQLHASMLALPTLSPATIPSDDDARVGPIARVARQGSSPTAASLPQGMASLPSLGLQQQQAPTYPLPMLSLPPVPTTSTTMPALAPTAPAAAPAVLAPPPADAAPAGGGVAGGIAAMSQEQLNQMLMILQQEILRRQL